MKTEQTEPASHSQKANGTIKLTLFLASAALAAAAFLTFDYLYSSELQGSVVSGGTQGYCFAAIDPVRYYALMPDCSCIRLWGKSSYRMFTNNLGFRDTQVRDVPRSDPNPRVLILGDSHAEGMLDWDETFVGRIAANFPQYDFLNGSMGAYSPSNYLNTARMVLEKGIEIDEVIVFLDISDAQDEAALFRDKDASAAVTAPKAKAIVQGRYGKLRAQINRHFLITDDLLEFFESALVRLGWYHLDRGEGNEFDQERGAWTYRKVNDTLPFEAGYAPLGLEAGIAREKAKMGVLWQELAKRNIPISVVVYPYPAQLIFDTADSRQVRIWREWCEGKCKRFISLFPAFFAVKERCPRLEPGCWYLNYFIFGDIHYNAAGNKLVADLVSQSLAEAPVVKRAPDSFRRGLKPGSHRPGDGKAEAAP
jgi:hypothetical protein